MPIGFTLPFTQSTGSVGYFETTETDVAAVKEDLKSLLLTNWGERVMHYYFGCNFQEFLFESLRTSELKTRMADRVLNQVDTWLPFVIVLKLNIFLTEDDSSVPENGVKVSMEFGLKSKPDLSSRLDVLVTS